MDSDGTVVVEEESGTLLVDVTVPGTTVVSPSVVGAALCPSLWAGGLAVPSPLLAVGVDAGGFPSVGCVVLAPPPPPPLPPARLGHRSLPLAMTTGERERDSSSVPVLTEKAGHRPSHTSNFFGAACSRNGDGNGVEERG